MKYVIGSLLAFALCVAAGIAVTRRISAKKGLKPVQNIIITTAVSILLIAVAFFAYLEVYYHAGTQAEKYLKSGSGVEVEETRSMYFFDGPGSGTAVVFYPGGKVEEKAYASLMHMLAEQGTDCFLLKLPFRMAVFAPNAPDDIIAEYDYDRWYLMGHSLGGIVAAEYNAKNPDDTDGVILLASYPTKPLPDSERMLSIYGTEDGCLNGEEYRSSRGLWPEVWSERIIWGGNHSGFGYYGPQKGDGQPEISAHEQQSLTIREIRNFLS